MNTLLLHLALLSDRNNGIRKRTNLLMVEENESKTGMSFTSGCTSVPDGVLTAAKRATQSEPKQSSTTRAIGKYSLGEDSSVVSARSTSALMTP